MSRTATLRGGRRPARTASRGGQRAAFLPESLSQFLKYRMRELTGLVLCVVAIAIAAALLSYHADDPSWNRAGSGTAVRNWLGALGAYPADLFIQTLGGAAWLFVAVPLVWAYRLWRRRPLGAAWARLAGFVALLPLGAAMLASFAAPEAWAGMYSFGGAVGSLMMGWLAEQAMPYVGWLDPLWFTLLLLLPFSAALVATLGLGWQEWRRLLALTARWAWFVTDWLVRHAIWLMRLAWHYILVGAAWVAQRVQARRARRAEDRARAPARSPATPRRRLRLAFWRRRARPMHGRTPLAVPDDSPFPDDMEADAFDLPALDAFDSSEPVVVAPGGEARVAGRASQPAARQTPPPPRPAAPAAPRRAAPARAADSRQSRLDLMPDSGYELPPVDLLAAPDPTRRTAKISDEALSANAAMLETVLRDFGVKGEIVKVNPGPVVTLYELEPAPGTKSSRVIGLADDIARSMAAISVRVAVVPGRNVIGIELPNANRDLVLLREILEAPVFARQGGKLNLILGKDIGGTAMIADLARMPHLLVAGTTGSGKSVAINTMILSLLYRLSPERCRFIMIDPKMLELSVYDGIPHLLAPVVTDPKQAVVALKWTVREMEDRYRAMSKLGVRNIEGYNARLREAKEKGETLMRRVQTGFDADTGKPVFEDQPIDLTELPYIVVVVDEMADLMMVAGKDIEAAIQRLAQMARAAGIHLIMATQRPSVDVITGTIKANFPTRISFQVTSKIDSRTILGEGGAEQLLGQGDMLYMAGGGRITRVHGPFVADTEVEQVVAHLKMQGEPDYNDSVLEDEPGSEVFEAMLGNEGGEAGGSGDELYDRAVALVARERKASTSFVQRHLQIGYNRAARIIEQMEAEGVVSRANHVGKREVLVGDHSGD